MSAWFASPPVFPQTHSCSPTDDYLMLIHRNNKAWKCMRLYLSPLAKQSGNNLKWKMLEAKASFPFVLNPLHTRQPPSHTIKFNMPKYRQYSTSHKRCDVSPFWMGAFVHNSQESVMDEDEENKWCVARWVVSLSSLSVSECIRTLLIQLWFHANAYRFEALKVLKTTPFGWVECQ